LEETIFTSYCSSVVVTERKIKLKSDKELYEEFLLGDKNSFEEIVIRYKEKLVFFIKTYVKNIDTAEDLMQDVFVYILINRKEYDFKYSLKTYLYTIAKSRAFNYIKKEKLVVSLEDFELVSDNDIEEQIFKREEVRNLRKAIKKLKPEWQSAIYLTKIEGMSYKDVCKILDKTLPQVKILIHRATRKLEELLRKERKYDI